MKKKVLSLFLALLMVLAVVPVSVLPVFALEQQNTETAEVTYKDLYVDGAKVLLTAFGDDISLENGKGTWKDALTGAVVGTLNGKIVEVGGEYKQVVKSETNGQELFDTLSKENVDHNGNKYRVTTEIYVDKSLALDVYRDWTKGEESYTVTKTVTRVEGWDEALGEYSVNKKVAIGGWYIDEDGGVRYDLPDFMVLIGLGAQDTHSLYIGNYLEYLPDGEYTVEITMSAGYATDTDGFQYTASDKIDFEGEIGSWQYGAMRIGPFNVMNRPSSEIGAEVQGSFGKGYVHYCLANDGGNGHRVNRLQFPSNFFQKTGSTVAIVKAAAGDNWSYKGYVNGAPEGSGFTTGVDVYGDAPNPKPTIDYVPNSAYTNASDTWQRFTLMNNAPGKLYGVRVYDKALSAEELNQNHLADLCGLYGVSAELIEVLLNDKEIRDIVVAKFASVKIEETSKDEIEDAINGASEEKKSIESAKLYASLYVEGAKVLLNAYNTKGVVSIDKSGNGTWMNLIDGKYANLFGSLGAASSASVSHTFAPNDVANSTVGYVTGKITYAEDGTTPLYAVKTSYLVSNTSSYNSNTQTKPIKINGGNVQYVAKMTYESFKWVADESATTYVKTSDFWEKTANGYHITDKYMIISDTEVSGASKRTRAIFTTERPADMIGWVEITGGKFVADGLEEYFGGWHDNGNSVSYDMADIALMNRKSSIRLVLDSSYLPAIDSEYTLEIVSKITPAIDTDSTINTFGYSFNWEGEMKRVEALNMGGFSQYWGIATDLYNNASAMYNTNYFLYAYQGANTPKINNEPGRSNFNVVLNDGSGYKDQIFTVSYDKTSAGAGTFNITQKVAYGVGEKTAEIYKGISITEPNTANFVLLQNVPNVTYSVRLYHRALNSTEKAQNHFADLAAYYQLDVTKVLELKEAGDTETLGMIYAAAGAFTLGATTKEALQKMVDDTITASVARRETMKYAALYAPGATAILLAYNAKNDGSIALNNGVGTWTNLVNGEVYSFIGKVNTYEVTEADGSKTTYTTGWKLGDKSVGFEISIQEAKAGNNHMIQLPGSLLGDAYTSTMELVSARQPMEFDNSGRTVGQWNGDYELWCDLVQGKNFVMHYKYAFKYEGYEGTITQVPSRENYNDYNDSGRWINKQNLWTVGDLFELDSKADRVVLTESPKGDGTMKLSIKYMSDALTVARDVQDKGATPLATSGNTTMNLFVNIPADVYAIRTYKRVLNDTELMQNHFADLCAYFALDIKNLALLSAEEMVGLYEAFATYTFENANADELQAILDGTVAELVDSPIRFEGVAGRLEDYAAIRGTFTFSVIEQKILAAKGLEVVDFGALVAIADGVEMSDLTVTFDGTQTTADGVIALVSNLAGMTYNYELDGIGVVYTLSVTYNGLSGDALKAAYETDLIYRGYIILADEDGEFYTLYTDGVTETFGDSASMKDVAEKLLENEAYADNEVLGGIIDACTPVSAVEQ